MEAINVETQKRVACLYRVSTKGQVDDNDIPMQKNACREFISKQKNWLLVKEYYEKGVSGFKLSANKRDEIQRVKIDAQKKLFDILLVFMFDRLGRKEDETPFMVKGLHDIGIEVWSVKEGEQRFDTHVDNLLNYIRFWQSSGESQKTSLRVDEKHKQMAKEGHFRGGDAPYGYKLIKSGEINKKGKELFKLAIDEETSKIVKKIFDFVYYEHYGANRITTYLNENNIESKKGGTWTIGVVNYILKNPIYKGFYIYGKRSAKSGIQSKQPKEEWISTEKPIEELIIIDEQKWDKVQEIRSSRTPEKMKRQDDNIVRTTKSPLLFVSLCKCGYCNSPMTTTYNYKSWTNKDGTEKRKIRAKYRCSGKANSRVKCEGQTIYAQEKIEASVLNQVYIYLEQLQKVDFEKEISKYEFANLKEDEVSLKELHNTNKENYIELDVLNKEVVKSIRGKSNFKPERLSKLIEEKEEEIILVESKIKAIEEKLKNKKLEVNDMLQLQKFIPVWKEEFEKATIEQKKMMLSTLIESITIYRDKVKIKVKLYVTQFIKSIKVDGVQNKLTWENKCVTNTTNKFIEKILVANLKKPA